MKSNTAIISATVVACVLIIAMTVLALMGADPSSLTGLIQGIPAIVGASFGAYAVVKVAAIDKKADGLGDSTDKIAQSVNGHLSALAKKAGIPHEEVEARK